MVVVPRLHGEDHSGLEHRIGQIGIAHRQPDMVAEEETGLHVLALIFGNRLLRYRLQLSQSHSRSYGGDDRIRDCRNHQQRVPLLVSEASRYRKSPTHVARVIIELASHVEDDDIAKVHRPVPPVVVRCENSPRPQRIGSGLDDRRECHSLAPASLACGFELGLETALLHAVGDVSRSRHDGVCRQSCVGSHDGDFGVGLDHPKSRDFRVGALDMHIGEAALKMVEQACHGTPGLDRLGGGEERWIDPAQVDANGTPI